MVCKVVALQDNTYTMWKRNFQTVALIYSWDIPVILPELYEYNYTSNNEMHFYIKNLSSGNHKDIWTCGTALKNGQIITSNQIQIDITGVMEPNKTTASVPDQYEHLEMCSGHTERAYDQLSDSQKKGDKKDK
ncbi:hypothetical protein MAR_021242 [Mya arenaria]|uniref:Retrotransposon Copia-like N-terminal domain-containing protein n=1 Tax=Mya arenaria TaxID=6604 RepID=A0ABY7EAW5_MYAAR|nr:hypothetical protein MAR_021242 [Mya arenaria]